MADYGNDAKLLIALIKNSITGEKLPLNGTVDDRFKSIMRLASFHQVAHLAAAALINNRLIKDENHLKLAEKQIFDESYRDIKNRYTTEKVQEILSAQKIPHILLKGSVIKEYYPEKWMRSSCDIDVLVRKKDFGNAVSALQVEGFVRDGNLKFHDISLLYNDTNLELHFSICENMKTIDSVLKNVWNYAYEKGGYEYKEERDFFVFHHIAHMSYHFLAGGCGIRPFLDLWILRRANFYDYDAVKKFCADAKIGFFCDAVMQLVDIWFEGKPHTDITLKMEKYILTGGAYGYFPNNAAVDTIRNGGKIRYMLALAFPPYCNMRVMYPVLNRVPVLLPFCYIYRLFEKTVGRDRAGAKKKYEVIKGQNDAFVKEVATLIKALKLDSKKGGKV